MNKLSIPCIKIASLDKEQGKTQLMCALIPHFKDWHIIRFTSDKEWRTCPKENRCGVCDHMNNSFDLIQDMHIITSRGKDICMYEDVGAIHTSFLFHPQYQTEETHESQHKQTLNQEFWRKTYSILDNPTDGTGVLLECCPVNANIQASISLVILRDIPISKSENKSLLEKLHLSEISDRFILYILPETNEFSVWESVYPDQHFFAFPFADFDYSKDGKHSKEQLSILEQQKTKGEALAHKFKEMLKISR